MIQALLTQAEYDKYSKIYNTYNIAKRRAAEPFRKVKINGKEMMCGPPPNYRMGPMSQFEIENFNKNLALLLAKVKR